MSEMIERVAKAIAEAAPWADGQLLPLDTAEYMDAARAAVLAMREPPIEVLRAADAQFGNSPGATGSIRWWRAMIDGALK